MRDAAVALSAVPARRDNQHAAKDRAGCCAVLRLRGQLDWPAELPVHRGLACTRPATRAVRLTSGRVSGKLGVSGEDGVWPGTTGVGTGPGSAP